MALQIGDRVRFLGGEGDANRGVLAEIIPSSTWGHSAVVNWDNGERAGIARINDLRREWRCALV
jgi:hypothetical protein